MNKKKIVSALFVILALVIGVFAGIVISSYDNISNSIADYASVNYNIDDIEYVNWNRNGNVFTSTNTDPQIKLNNINSYVNNLLFSGTITDYENAVVKFYYTNNENEEFSEEKSFFLNPSSSGGYIYFAINREIRNLRIDLYDVADTEVTIDSLTLNPRNLNFSITIIFSSATLCVLAMTLFISFFSYRKSFKASFIIFRKYRFLLSDLILRDLKVKYRRSFLGFLWSILNPLLMMLVITAVFSNIFKFDVKDFPVYYLTGSLIFNFVSEATSSSLSSVINAGSLIKKVYIPKYIFPLEKCLFAFVNMLFSLIAVAVVFVILQIEIHWTLILLPVPMIYAFVFSVGLSFILSTTNVFFRDVGHLYSVWITAWMYLTPIIYPVSLLPEIMLNIIKMNPLYYYVEYTREVMLYGTVPSLQNNLICIGFSFIFLLIGLLVFKKKQDKFILYI